MSRIVIAQNRCELERLRSAWHRLFHLTPGNTLFQRVEWNALAAEVFAAQEQPYIVYVEDEDGAALVPACLAGNELRLLGETLFDYRMPLASSRSALQIAWEEVARLGVPLRIEYVPGGEAPDWGPFISALYSRAPRTSLDAITADSFFSSHARSRRLLHRLQERGAAIRRDDGASRWLPWIYEAKAATPDNLFRDPLRREFMLRIARERPAECDLFLLELKGRIAAALVTFRDGVWRRFYTTYHDHEVADLSPGSALLFAASHETLREGLSCDYMTGEQPYKLRLATSSVPLWRMTATAEQLRGAVRPAALHAA